MVPVRIAPSWEHLQRLTTCDADSLESIRSDLDPKFCEVVATMLARQPDGRPESAQQVCELLAPFAATSHLDSIAEQSMIKVDLQREQDSKDKSSDVPETRVNVDEAALPPVTATQPELDRQHQPIAAQPQTSTGRQRVSWGVALLSLLIGLVGGWQAVTLWIQTGDATLKVESEVDDITLELIQDGKVVDEIEVRNAQDGTSVLAGKYELKIAGKSDGVRVDQRSLLLLRGDERLVRITRVPSSELPTAPDSGTSPTGTIGKQLADLQTKLLELQTQFGVKHAKIVEAEAELTNLTHQLERIATGTSSAPTSRGRTYQEWLKIVLLETDAPTVAEGITALVDLSTEDNYSDTFQTFLTVAEQNEKRCKQPICDAYIRYLCTGDPRTRAWERVYHTPDKDWTAVVDALNAGLQHIRTHISDESVDLYVENGSEASRRILLVSELSTPIDRNRLHKVDMSKRLAQKHQPNTVRAIAHHVLLTTLELPADESTRDALLSDDEVLARAVSLTLLLRNQYPFPDEQGAVCGKLIAGGTPWLADQVDELIAEAASEGQEFRGRDSCLLLESVGSAIVRAWSKESQRDELYSGVATVTRLATCDLMMAATRRSAVQQLRFYLTQQLTKRNSRTSHLDNSELSTRIFQSAEALAFLDGQLPDELQTLRMNPDSAIGKAFDQWGKKLAADPEQAINDAVPWFMQYPLETASLAMKLLGDREEDTTDLQQKTDPRFALRRQSNPLDQLVPPWLAIPIAGSNPSDPQTQIAVHRVLDEYSSESAMSQAFAIVPTGYGKDLYRIAQAGKGRSQQGFALRLALKCEYDEQKVAELAQSILVDLFEGQTDKKLSPGQVVTLSWCLDCIDTAGMTVDKELAKTFSTYALRSKYYGTMILNHVMSRCFRCALSINRRSEVSGEEDDGLLKLSLGMRVPDVRVFWARPRSSNESNDYFRFALPTPKVVTTEALKSVIAMPMKDQEVLKRLQSMRSITLEHGIRPEEADAVKLLEKAIAATETAIAE